MDRQQFLMQMDKTTTLYDELSKTSQLYSSPCYVCSASDSIIVIKSSILPEYYQRISQETMRIKLPRPFAYDNNPTRVSANPKPLLEIFHFAKNPAMKFFFSTSEKRQSAKCGFI